MAAPRIRRARAGDVGALAEAHALARASAMPGLAPLFAEQGEHEAWLLRTFIRPPRRPAQDRRVVWSLPSSVSERTRPEARVAVSKGVPIGLAAWFRSGGWFAGEVGLAWDPIHLRMLHVHPDWQRRGVGARLLAALDAWVAREMLRMRASGRFVPEGAGEAPETVLWVFEANTAAQRFYARHGFATAGAAPQRRSTAGLPLVTMRRAPPPGAGGTAEKEGRR